MESLAEEFGTEQRGPQDGPQPVATRVLDLDEDGPAALSQFGMVQQVV